MSWDHIDEHTILIPHLETDITQACQLSCVACNHHVPLWRTRKGGPWSTTPQQVERDLNHLTTFLHAGAWGALGGEPLLSKHLVDILKVVRASRIADRIEVWTNGLLLPRMKPEFWRSLDTLVVSLYPGKQTEEEISWIKAKCADEGVAFTPRDERNEPNFMTLLEPVRTGPEATREKFAGCFFRHYSRVANFGYFFTCCCSPHMPMLINGQEFGTDGVLIEDLTREGLLAYLQRTDPLDSCYTCAGRHTAVAIPWSEERDPSAWMRKSAGQ